MVVADVHLGHAWAERRRGNLVPKADQKTAAKLLETAAELRPAAVVFAGDAVHASAPGSGERAFIEDVLRELRRDSALVFVRGNHDRAFARDFGALGFDVVSDWRADGMTVFHGDRAPLASPEGQTLALGHIHPAAVMIDAAGAGHKVPVFVVAPNLIVLPAFSPFAGGVEVGDELPAELARLAGGPCFAIAATGRTIAPLGPLRAFYRSDGAKMALE
jgi:putative SbcD/Mre11-related phosphoesterase